MIEEVDRVLYNLGYYDSDPHKKAAVKGFIQEAEEYMTEAGVPADKMKSQRAFAIKNIWADARDKGNPENIVKKEGMIVNLISNLKR